MKCKICNRTAKSSEFCTYHAAARAALSDNYAIWRKAYSNIGWRDYLQRVKGLPGTGRWVKEVIEMMMEEKKDAVEAAGGDESQVE